MHILGARSGTARAALTALRELRARFALGEHDAEVLPLGTTEYDAPTSDLILAARFHPEVVPQAVTILEDFGGEVVAEHSEWPGSPPAASPPQQGSPPPRGSIST